MDIVPRIKERLQYLRAAEKKVALFILENLVFSANAPIAELAEKIEVSAASITRLAKALDCKNVRELKLKLAQSAAVGERFISDKLIEKKSIPTIYRSIHEILELNTGLISEATIEKVGKLIANAEQVLIYGVGGGSRISSQEFQYRLFRLDVKSNAYSDPVLMRMTAAAVDPGDMVICLSLSGESPDVYAAANIAKEYGAKVVSICPKGTLAKRADFHLEIKTDESDYIFKPSAARYVMLATIDILASEVAVKNQRKSREKLRRLKHHLDEYRPGAKRYPLGD